MRGKPLLAWTLDQALAWGKGSIVLSSDDPEVGSIWAQRYLESVIYHDRDHRLAADGTPKMEVLKAIARDYPCEYLIDLDVTNPLRRLQDIENAYQMFCHDRPDVLMSVTDARRNPYFNQVKRVDGEVETAAGRAGVITRRQDAPIVYDLNCSIYIYRVSWLLADTGNTPVIPGAMLYVMPSWAAFDIDSELDWQLVEYLLGAYEEAL